MQGWGWGEVILGQLPPGGSCPGGGSYRPTTAYTVPPGGWPYRPSSREVERLYRGPTRRSCIYSGKATYTTVVYVNGNDIGLYTTVVYISGKAIYTTVVYVSGKAIYTTVVYISGKAIYTTVVYVSGKAIYTTVVYVSGKAIYTTVVYVSGKAIYTTVVYIAFADLYYSENSKCHLSIGFNADFKVMCLFLLTIKCPS